MAAVYIDFLPLFGSARPAPGAEGAWVWQSGRRAGADDTMLTPEEEARLARLVDPEKRGVTRGFLIERKWLLGVLLGRSPDEVRIAHDRQGKPLLETCPDVSISLSDSDGWNALALSCRGGVGIDIERVRPLAWQSMLPMMSEPAEAARISEAINQAQSLTPFFRAWTMKEAVLKAAGTGLRGGAARIVLSTDFLREASSETCLQLNNARFSVRTVTGDAFVVSCASCA